jgi:hypothetical protein
MTHNHIQAAAETDGELQLLKTTDVLGGLKEKLRLGRVGERLPGKIQYSEVFHIFTNQSANV